MPDTWDPQQYEKFKRERAQPFYDLAALVEPRPGLRIIDLGCGTGELTRELHQRLHAGHTVGIDSSESMLGKARGDDEVSFRLGRIEDCDLQGADLLFSNAAIHWVDDHPRLLRRCYDALPAGGQLAVQMPANFDHPSHRTADELAAESPFRNLLAGYQRGNPILSLREYAQVLHEVGFTRQRVLMQVYAHVLPAPGDVVEWVRGTLLTPIQERLGPARYAEFLDAYRRRLLPQLGDQRPYLYTFQRVLFWAAK